MKQAVNNSARLITTLGSDNRVIAAKKKLYPGSGATSRRSMGYIFGETETFFCILILVWDVLGCDIGRYEI